MDLRPSEIFYSQKSISNTFKNSSKGIGLLVNDVCNGSVSIGRIPTISVAKVGDKWFTADNRRLWVFKQLEARGKCEQIRVKEIPKIPPFKMTTENGGVSVKIRGDPYASGTPSYRSSYAGVEDIDDNDYFTKDYHSDSDSDSDSDC